ncbi:MAG: hypothetical protein JWR10_4785 [Rubritepida sp.]|nr:hypothetical protein [Rubritepida sp.]
MTDADPFDLQRFASAQAPVIGAVLEELGSGRKQSHWMWFVFPQLRALGFSGMAKRYGIGTLDEARAYLAHPLLGARLLQCTQAVLAIQGRSLHEIFGSPDDMKFRSCMTLFAAASPDEGSLFRQAVDRLCGGQMDERTLTLLPPADRA